MTASPPYVEDPEKWVEEITKESETVCIVIFRGSWCKYEKAYLPKLGDELKQHPVKLIAWTSEGAEGAKKADEEWGLTKEHGFSLVIGDETNKLAEWLKEDELLPMLSIVTPEEAKVQDVITPGTYPNGIVMSGQAWWAHHGTICFEWANKFEEPTLGGPTRPDPAWVWGAVSKRMHALDVGSAIMPVHGDSIQMCCTES
jgi:hypothetical protein